MWNEKRRESVTLTQILVVPKEDDEGERDLLLQQARHNLQAISESVREGLVANFGPDLHVTLTWRSRWRVISREGLSELRRMEKEQRMEEALKPVISLQ